MPAKPTPDDVLQDMLNHLAKHGGNLSQAARTWIDAAGLTIPRPTYQHRIEEARRRGMQSELPTLVLKGQSILYDAHGNETGRWDKTKRERQAPHLWRICGGPVKGGSRNRLSL